MRIAKTVTITINPCLEYDEFRYNSFRQTIEVYARTEEAALRALDELKDRQIEIGEIIRKP